MIYGQTIFIELTNICNFNCIYCPYYQDKKEKGFIKNSDYSKLTNRAKATRVLDFQKMISLGLVERKGKGRATYYILKTQS